MTPLHEIGEMVRQWMLAVPMPVVRCLFVALPVIVLVWMLRLPKSETEPPGGAQRWDENLKIGAGAALVIQIVIYCLL